MTEEQENLIKMSQNVLRDYAGGRITHARAVALLVDLGVHVDHAHEMCHTATGGSDVIEVKR